MVRNATPADAGRIAEIHVTAWRHACQGLLPDAVLFVDRTVAKSLAYWERLLAASSDSVLVFDDGVVKGFCHHGPCRDLDAVDDWEIQAIYVQPEFLRRGIGRALLEPVEAAARTRGCRRVRLWTLEENAQSAPFYARQGYRPDGGVKVVDQWGRARELRYAKDLEEIR